jgi:hypothetical protein
VVGEVRRLAALPSPKPALRHWRSHGGAELDLILERDGTLYPLEIKASARPARRDTTGFAAFREAVPRARIAPGLVVSAVERSYALAAGVLALPWDAELGERSG